MAKLRLSTLIRGTSNGKPKEFFMRGHSPLALCFRAGAKLKLEHISAVELWEVNDGLQRHRVLNKIDFSLAASAKYFNLYKRNGQWPRRLKDF